MGRGRCGCGWAWFYVLGEGSEILVFGGGFAAFREGMWAASVQLLVLARLRRRGDGGGRLYMGGVARVGIALLRA